jgi:protein TonB
MRPRATPYRIGIAGLISLALHLSIAAGILLLGRRPVPPPDAPDKPVTVELAMEEQQGAGETMARPPSAGQRQPQPPSPPPLPPDDGPSKPAPATAPPTPPPPLSKPAETAQPAPPQPVPQISLGGTDSPSNAIVQRGENVIPATPDKAARNRPPVYPQEAARRGQQGTVLLAIHVGPSGLPFGVDVERSSGYPLLDKSAEEAVMKWTFVPAVKDGLPVPYDFRMNFTFAFE